MMVLMQGMQAELERKMVGLAEEHGHGEDPCLLSRRFDLLNSPGGREKASQHPSGQSWWNRSLRRAQLPSSSSRAAATESMGN
jgi:hypothetical protein